MVLWALAASIPMEAQAGVSVRSETLAWEWEPPACRKPKPDHSWSNISKSLSRNEMSMSFGNAWRALQRGYIEPNPDRLTRSIGPASGGLVAGNAGNFRAKQRGLG